MQPDDQLRIMRGMYGRRGVKFFRESDLGTKPPSETTLASRKDINGDTWVAVGPKGEFNPAEIDLIEQLLHWTVDHETGVLEKAKEDLSKIPPVPSPEMQREYAVKTPVPGQETTRVIEALSEPRTIKAMAIASLVLSISALPASIVGCGLLFPVFAIALGLIAYIQARKIGSPRNTQLMALAGTILGGLLAVTLVIILIVSQL
jgi:hypothetical protein